MLYVYCVFISRIWVVYKVSIYIPTMYDAHYARSSSHGILVAYEVSIYIPAMYTGYDRTSACFRISILAVFNFLSRVYVIWILIVLIGF